MQKEHAELAGRVSQDKSLLPVEVRGSCPPAAGPNHWRSRRRTSTTGVSGEQCVSAPTSVTRQRQPSGPGVEAETERERQRARVWARPSLVARSRSSQEAGQVQERPLAAAVCAGRFHVASTRHEGWEEGGWRRRHHPLPSPTTAVTTASTDCTTTAAVSQPGRWARAAWPSGRLSAGLAAAPTSAGHLTCLGQTPHPLSRPGVLHSSGLS